MKHQRILITGGAGFIGSFLSDRLVEMGHSVTIFDNLEDQVHFGRKPAYLPPQAKFIKGDVRDYQALARALSQVDEVYHLAARVGVGQSNYQIKDYVDANIGGTANLADFLVNHPNTIRKITVSASMSSYGEGNCRCVSCGVVKPGVRDTREMAKKQWGLRCPRCRKSVTPIATNEETSIQNNSVYALSKNVEENLLMLVGRMYGIPVTSLRFFNVYGPRQSLSNPYTGVVAIFISRLKNNQPPVVYEDGLQTRDFISIHDAVLALVKARESSQANWQIINIGSGEPLAIKDLAVTLSQLMHKKIRPLVSGKFRKGDVRHCFADIRLAQKLLGWKPEVSLEQGLVELIAWSEKQPARDLFDKAEKELSEKKLL